MEEEVKEVQEEKKDETKVEIQPSTGTAYITNGQNGMGGIVSPQP